MISTILKRSTPQLKYLFASERFAKYNFEDPLNLASLLTEEERMVFIIRIIRFKNKPGITPQIISCLE